MPLRTRGFQESADEAFPYMFESYPDNPYSLENITCQGLLESPEKHFKNADSVGTECSLGIKILFRILGDWNVR